MRSRFASARRSRYAAALRISFVDALRGILDAARKSLHAPTARANFSCSSSASRLIRTRTSFHFVRVRILSGGKIRARFTSFRAHAPSSFHSEGAWKSFARSLRSRAKLFLLIKCFALDSRTRFVSLRARSTSASHLFHARFAPLRACPNFLRVDEVRALQLRRRAGKVCTC